MPTRYGTTTGSTRTAALTEIARDPGPIARHLHAGLLLIGLGAGLVWALPVQDPMGSVCAQGDASCFFSQAVGITAAKILAPVVLAHLAATFVAYLVGAGSRLRSVTTRTDTPVASRSQTGRPTPAADALAAPAAREPRFAGGARAAMSIADVKAMAAARRVPPPADLPSHPRGRERPRRFGVPSA